MRRIFLFLLLLFILIVLACPNYNSGEVGYGNLSLKINFPEANSRFATITPELDVQQYVIDFVEYNGESVQKDSVAVTDGACSISLAAGIWDLYIYAVSTAGYKIAELEVEDISIKISGVNNFAIDLIPVAGTGTVSVSLDVSEKPGEISIESVEYSLLKGRSSPVEVDSGVLASPYLISYTGDSGTDYILKININTDSGVVFLEGAVHVYAGNTTIGILTVSSSDFYKSSTPIIADHTVVELYDDIPTEWIAEVKKMLLIMGGESHGRAYNYGLNLLEVQDPTYAVSTQWSAGELEAGTDQHLRASRSYRFGETWKDTMGEADCFTNSDAISNMKTGLSYVAANYSGKIVQGFGWCWDMTWVMLLHH